MNMLYGASVVLSGVSLILFFLYAYRKNRLVFRAGTFLLAAGMLTLAVFLGWAGARLHGHPAMMPFLSYNVMALLIYILFFLFEFRFKIPLLGTFLVPIGFFFNMLSLFAQRLQVDEIRRVSGFLLGIHTGFLLLGEALFLLAFATSVMYLIQEKNLKSKRFNQWYSRFPSLAKLSELSGLGVSAGFPLITGGLIIGFYWASRVWGPGWYADPKVIWSTLTWLAYALLFYGWVSNRIHGRRLAISVILCTFLIMGSLLISRFFTVVHTMKDGLGVN